MIEVEGINKFYGRKNKQIQILDDISFSIKKGEIVGLLGSNGAGKTTLIKILIGLIQPEMGHIQIKGMSTKGTKKKRLRHISSVLEGNRNLYWRLTVQENIDYFLGNRGIASIERKQETNLLLKKFNLYEKKNILVKNLSRGMQQKVAIIVALVADTEILLLDEPSLGLDVESTREILELLQVIVKKSNKAVIISSHDMSLIEELCQRVIILHGGKVVTDDTVSNLMNLFNTKAYSFFLDADLTAEQRTQLQEQRIITAISNHEGKTVLELTITSNQQFYELIEALRKIDVLIESIDKKQPNFETVFLNIVKGQCS